MARFIIRFYSLDNVLSKEVSVTGRKLYKKLMNWKDSVEQNEDLYYDSKKNKLSIRWIVRYNGKLDFVSHKSPNYSYHKIIELWLNHLSLQNT